MNPTRPRLSFLIPICIFLFLCGTAVPIAEGQTSPPVQYEVSLEHPERHLFHVLMKVPVRGEALVQMPAWNALYEIRDFASHIQEVQAHIGTSPARIEKIDKQTWRLSGEGVVRIDYAIYWDEPGPFAAQLNSDHAFINPALLLMYVVGHTADKALLSIADFPADWRLASAARFSCGPVFQHSFCAGEKSTYDQIVDAPIEMGKVQEFDLAGVPRPVTVTVHGKLEHPEPFKEKLEQICKYEIVLMGGAPFERYTFIFHIGENVGGGGMEHANGTAIAARTEEGLLHISAHEFFHLWNVKRIRPASLEPVDYTKEQYTKSLWFAEGVTSTYERYAFVRTGLWTKNLFYGELGRQISDLESHPANAWQSAEQSSLDTWFEKYPIYYQPDHSVSYYTKGAIIGVLLDLWIREQTNNTRSLDDMMRGMNEQFGKTGKPYRDREDLEAVCSQTAKKPCKEFFDNFVSGTVPFPYDEYFGFAGLKIRRTVHSSPQMGTQTAFEISEDESASEKQKRIRAGILAGTTEKAAAAPN